MRSFDLDDLHIFCTVARSGGIHAGAALLNRVPSNITARIKQLEQSTGWSLFRKQGRGIVLTDAGRSLLSKAESLLQQADLLDAEIKHQVPPARLRLGALESAAATRLPPVLARLHQAAPQLQIELRTGHTAAMLTALDEGAVDAVFVSEPFSYPAGQQLGVFNEELILISPLSLEQIDDPLRLAALSAIAFPVGCAYRQRLEQWYAGLASRPPQILELASYHAIIACVAAGSGVAMVPASVLDLTGMAQSVRRHQLAPQLAHNTTHLVWRDEPDPALQALIDLLQAESREAKTKPKPASSATQMWPQMSAAK